MSEDITLIDEKLLDPECVLEELLQSFQIAAGRNIYPADPEMIRLKWFADIIIQERLLINITGLMNLLNKAEGAYLDAICLFFFNTKRLQATPAVTVMRFFLSETMSDPQTIEQGTRIGIKDIVFETVEPLIISAGILYGDVKALCQTPGRIGNGFIPGQIKDIIDIYPFYKKCENITISGGGSDVESDKSYRERAALSLQAYSTCGAESAYIYWAKSIDGGQNIADVYPFSPSPVHLDIKILMNGGEMPTQDILDKVLEAVNPKDRRPMTDLITVSAPNTVIFNIDVNYWIASNATKKQSEIETAVNKAVTDYILWQTQKMGRDIEPAELIMRMKLAGAKRPLVYSPSDTAVPAGSVAQLGTIRVQCEGIEDE